MKKLITFGVFDLLHAGHIHLFKQAALHGDLIVVTADDASIFQFKGADRPIIPLEERVVMLESVKYISEVHTFSFTMKNIMEAHAKIISEVSPDIFVQGEQANHEYILPVVKRFGIPILTVSSLKTSTTKIINKIRSFSDYEQPVGGSYLSHTLTTAEMRP